MCRRPARVHEHAVKHAVRCDIGGAGPVTLIEVSKLIRRWMAHER
jgi:hypothetical protein